MRLVILESPYKAATPEGLELNLRYARLAMRDALLRGEAPYASHLLYTQPGVLDDALDLERRLGIEAGLAWGLKADATVVYTDLGVSEGMLMGIQRAMRVGRPVEDRKLPGWPDVAAAVRPTKVPPGKLVATTKPPEAA